MKHIVLGLTALTILAASSAFATDHTKTTTTTEKSSIAQTHRQEMKDKWANATPEERAKMKSRHQRRMAKMHDHHHAASNLPAGQPQHGFRNQPVQQH